ncbi:autoinducer binding domain-containing protein [Cognatiyoonia sp. IB215446]|uniref:autoinducer binding domain-containing protein n=1 Tax=Cognatiyoonia sp. IB215446 TaxID=3097355 RepID=UPI002A0CCB29|nr:autoinducer binding domain-containing protein [Cognatiyoonia sp. IB215446]MDX8346922.1 autoinducer binding domain-containing protein [Cognatiyoonia sp. IB215446]
MPTHILQWCEDELSKVETVDQLLLKTTAFLGSSGVKNVGLFYRSFFERRAFSNFPEEWVLQYRQDNLETKDPVFRRAFATGLPTCWSSAYKGQEGSEFKDRAKDAGLPDDGITMSIMRRSTCIVMFSVCGDIPSDEVECKNEGLTLMVELIARRFWLKLSELEHELDDLRVSPREVQTLYWAACGKSAWETAKILGLSEGTVNQYLHSAARKLGAASKTHSVIRAIDAGVLRGSDPIQAVTALGS